MQILTIFSSTVIPLYQTIGQKSLHPWKAIHYPDSRWHPSRLSDFDSMEVISQLCNLAMQKIIFVSRHAHLFYLEIQLTPLSPVREASFASLYTFISIFLYSIKIRAIVMSSLNHYLCHIPSCINKLNKILTKCLFYIWTILHFFENYLLTFHSNPLVLLFSQIF